MWNISGQGHRSLNGSERNLIVGHSEQRSVEDRYIRVSDRELLRAVDAMTFDRGWTELDLVEEAK